jgi:hypothetical protein
MGKGKELVIVQMRGSIDQLVMRSILTIISCFILHVHIFLKSIQFSFVVYKYLCVHMPRQNNVRMRVARRKVSAHMSGHA